MKLYRICTENTNTEKIIDCVSEYFAGFTSINAIGYWEKTPENSIIIEIMADEKEYALVRLVAHHIAQANNQQCVLVQTLECQGEFIYQ